MKERETVLPIFYDVDPSAVRKQTGSFVEAFANHEERFRDDMEKVRRWRCALREVASYSGWNSKEWYESKLIRNIVEVIWTTLQPTAYTCAENLVGIHSRLQQVNLLLGVGADDVRFIGIWGMGGIGKTTMVRVVHERISYEFEFSFLLTNVRDSVEKSGILNLQRQLLSGIWTRKAEITDLHEGATIIRRLLSHKKVLLILDDVSHSSHLKYLAGKEEWFGSGSRVLITTRNEHLLIEHGVKRRLKVEELNDEDSLQLFSWKAFKRGYPEENFLKLSESVIDYAKGLPLALEVLGSFLYGRDLSEWKSALRKLGRVSNLEIFGVLKLSYDDLDSEEKKIFLDIACFFNGQYKDRVVEFLSSFDVSAVIGIKVLMERSLLTLLHERLWMHDLLREMGHEIVHREFPSEPGRRSRLWLLEDIRHVLTNNTGTEAIEGIYLYSTKPEVQVNIHRKSFSMMNKLTYLKIDNGSLPEGLDYLPGSLRILDWTRYPLKSLPSQFNPQKLLELSLCHSSIEHFWIGTEPLYNLKTIILSHSLNLVTASNFKDMPHLEFLSLEGCIRLYEVDPGIEVLERLAVLNLKDCKNLVHFARRVSGLKSLKVLNLSGCSKINKLPDDTGLLGSLEELNLNETSIKDLPTSTGMLERLAVLNLEDCKNLVCLPSSVGGLKSLRHLNVSGCPKLDKLPDELGYVTCLEELDMSRSGIREVPSFISLLKSLKVLSLAGCKAQSSKSWTMMFNPFQLLVNRSCVPTGLSLAGLSGLHSLTRLNLSDCNLSEEAFPSNFGRLASLTSLDLSKNQFVRLPDSIGRLSRLESLSLDQCGKLQTLPKLRSFVRASLKNCISLDIMEIEQSSVLDANCVNCFKMAETGSYKSNALSLLTCYLNFRRTRPFNLQDWSWPGSFNSKHDRFNFAVPGNEIPEWYNLRSAGSLIAVELHPGWFSNEWMGHATCVVFRLLKPLPPSVNMYICCIFYINGEFVSADGLSFQFGETSPQPKSDHIWFYYGHRYTYRHSIQQWNDFYCQGHDCQLMFSFIPFFEDIKGQVELEDTVEVKKCGVRMVYEEDVELWQTLLKQSNTKQGLQHDHDDASSSASQAHQERIEQLHLSSSRIRWIEDA